MSDDKRGPGVPRTLGTPGRKLWRAVIADAKAHNLSLDSLELSHLEQAGLLADKLDELTAELAGAELVVNGYRGAVVAHPLLAEQRMTRQLLSLTLSRIRLVRPAEAAKATGVVQIAGVNMNRRAANIRHHGKDSGR